MKRIFSFIAACAMILATAGCQEELVQPEVQQPVEGLEYVDITFDVTAPSGPQTKTTYGETVTFPTELFVEVYVGEDNEFGAEGLWLKDVKKVITPKDNSNTEWEVTLTLVKNYLYDIVFWAQRETAAPYTFDWENGKITANYAVAANDITRDAFYHLCENYNSINYEGASYKIGLKRPFAQINLGASDYSALEELYEFVGKKDSDLQSKIVTSTSATLSVPSVLNVLTGTADTPAAVNFSLAYTTPADKSYNLVADENDIKVTGKDAEGKEVTKSYTLVGTNYILANVNKPDNPTMDITMTFAYNGKSFDIEVPNVPYARNYQTNILGNYFTDESKFEVLIKPAFSDENDNPNEDFIYDLNLGLVDAFKAENNAVCNLKQDEVISEPLILDNEKILILNLDQYSITASKDLWSTDSKVWSMISVRNGSTLIINSKSGSVVARENDAYAIDVRDGSTLEINGGNYVGNISAVYVLKGTANINGGSYSILQLAEPANGGDERFTLNCDDAARRSGDAVINVTGGSFVNFDPSNNLAEGQNTDFVPAGYKVVSKEDNGNTVYTVVELNPIEKAVADGANTVVLSEDLVLDETIAVASELTIDLGGKALSTETTPAFLANANLTITNGTANVAKELVRVGAGVTVTLDDVTAVSEGDNCVFVPKESKDATVVVAEGTSLTSKGAAAIQSNGNTEGLNLTIAGTVVSDGDVAVYLPQVEKCTVASTAKISGVTGIEIRAGELVVEDGAEISATENTLTATANGNGSTVTGAAVAVSPHTTNLPITVTVEGGEFSCANSIYEINFYDDRTASTTLEVKGGTFNAPIYSENCTGFITGGTFVEAAKPEDKYLADEMVYDETTGEVVGVTLTVATVAEFLAAAENDTMMYELTGVITNVANTTYGNFDLTDETGTVYIYGLCSPEGAYKYWAESGAKLGDTITIRTIRTSFSGSPQGKNAIFVELVPFVEEASEWGVVGDITSWETGSDITMYTTWKAENLFVAYNVEIASGAFKIRANNEWNDAKNYGLNVAGNIYADKYYAMTNGAGSQNITPMVYGTYDVYFDLANERVALVTPGKEYADAADGGDPVVVIEGLKNHEWGVIGSFAASNWETDVVMEVVGDWAIAKNVALANGDKFKFRANKSWDDPNPNYGSGCDVNVGATYTTYSKGGDMTFVGESGAYNIYFSLVDAKFYMEKYIPPTTVEVTMASQGYANGASVETITLDENVTLTFEKGGASTAPAYYTSGEAVRLYQNGAIMNVSANGRTITSVEITFANNMYYLAADSGEFTEEAAVRTWTGSADAVKFTCTGTDKNHRAYINAIKVTYE